MYLNHLLKPFCYNKDLQQHGLVVHKGTDKKTLSLGHFTHLTTRLQVMLG